MKKYLLLICFLMFSSLVSYSQNAIAKLKYEDAEIAFSNNQFSEAIVKLDEAEKILGSTNPKILYLRIMSQKKIIENDPVANFDQIKSAKENSRKYLIDYEPAEEIDDKYKDVYKASEYFNKYPDSREEYLEKINGVRQLEEVEAIMTVINQDQLNLKINSFELYPNMKTGIPYKTLKQTCEFVRENMMKESVVVGNYLCYVSDNLSSQDEFQVIIGTQNEQVKYIINQMVGSDIEGKSYGISESEVLALYETTISELKNLFGNDGSKSYSIESTEPNTYGKKTVFEFLATDTKNRIQVVALTNGQPYNSRVMYIKQGIFED